MRRRHSADERRDRTRRHRMFDALVTPPETVGPTQRRVVIIARRLRLGVAMAFLVVVPVLPGFAARSKLIIALGIVAYVGASWYVEERAEESSWVSARVVNPLVGILMTLFVGITIPEVFGASLFIYLLGLIYYTLVGGLGLGLWIAVGVLPTAIATNYLLIPDEHRIDPVALAFFGLTMFAAAFLCDLVTRERRLASTELDRLHEAIGSVSSSPNLGATLTSIVDVLNRAMGARSSCVLLHEADHFVLAVPTVDDSSTQLWAPERIEAYTRGQLALGDSTPFTAAMRHQEVVWVPAVVYDKRFPHWCDDWRSTLRDAGIESLAAVPLRLGSEVIGVLVVGFDVVDALEASELGTVEAFADQVALVIARAQAYEQQHEAARRLEEADRVKSEFLAMVSHELRTPLTAAKGFVDTVLRRWDDLPDERRRHLLELASSNADELARLVIQLVEFSRMEADRVQVQPEPCNLRALVDGVLGHAGPVLANHRLEVVVPEQLAVCVDPDAFGQVLLNLVTNAVKFSPPESRITVSAYVEGDEVVVAVHDQGVGIAPEDQERIFERFYQAPNSEASRRGTGIGLAITRRLVEMHGGRVWVASVLGEGSTFSFSVPPATGGDETAASALDGSRPVRSQDEPAPS